MNTTLITLNDGEFSTYTISPSNTFSFPNVPPGVNVLDVHSQHFHFSQVKIQILDDISNVNVDVNVDVNPNTNAGQEPKRIEYFYPGAAKRPIAYPLTLYANPEYQYFTPRPTFSPFNLLRHPMILMSISSVGMMFVMPHLMWHLAPEQMEQMKKQMESQQDTAEILSELWGEISGGGGAGTKEITEKKVVRKERLKRE